MSDTFSNQPSWQPPTQSAGVSDVVTQLQNIVRQLSSLTAAITGRVAYGSFTMPAAATLTIQQPAIKGNSVITLIPTDASAGTLQGSAKYLYPSAIVAGTSFTVSTASGGNAAGSETFSYTINTPT